MNMTKKNTSFIAVFAFVFTLAITMMLAFSVSAFAADDAAAETPEIFCEYYDEQGNQVDGNSLVAGTYDVSFIISGISEASALEITSTYDTDVITVNGINDSISSMTSMGSVTADGNLVVGFVSDGDSVAINEDAQFIASVKMTFAEDCDAEDYLTVSENPNLTFVVTNSADNNYDDEYALVASYPDYTGALSLMTCDVTPSMGGYTVEGQIMISGDLIGTTSGITINGITVDVIDGNNNIIASDTTKGNGNYKLTGIPAGQYIMSIHGDTTIDRQVALIVAEDKTVDSVGVVVCDYNHDTIVDGVDLASFLVYFSGDDNNIYTDFNADQTTDGTDLAVLLIFYEKVINYEDVTL